MLWLLVIVVILIVWIGVLSYVTIDHSTTRRHTTELEEPELKK